MTPRLWIFSVSDVCIEWELLAQNFHVALALKKKEEEKKKGVGGVCVYKANQIRFNPRLISDFYVSSDTSSCSPVCLEAELQDQSTVFPGGSVAVDLS